MDLGFPARNQVLPGKPMPTWEELRRASELHIEAYNHALQGIPQEPAAHGQMGGSGGSPT